MSNLPLSIKHKQDSLETAYPGDLTKIPRNFRHNFPASSGFKFQTGGTEYSGRIVMVEPVKEVRQLRVQFQLNSLRHLYRKNPARLVSKLVGHECPGSALSVLKRKGELSDEKSRKFQRKLELRMTFVGWAETLSCGLARRNYTFDIFSVEIGLTKAGISTFF